MAETTWERKKTKAEDSKASTKRPEHHNLYLANTREVGPRSRGFRGRGLVVGGKGSLYLVFYRDFFWEYVLLGWYLTQKK